MLCTKRPINLLNRQWVLNRFQFLNLFSPEYSLGDSQTGAESMLGNKYLKRDRKNPNHQLKGIKQGPAYYCVLSLLSIQEGSANIGILWFDHSDKCQSGPNTGKISFEYQKSMKIRNHWLTTIKKQRESKFLRQYLF